MNDSHTLSIAEVENYVNTIFELQDKIRHKDLKIVLLEFEVAIQKNLLEAFKRCHQVEETPV